MMDSLRGDVGYEILSRLPIESLMQCRLVCRRLRDLTLEPYFTRIHTARSLALKPEIIYQSMVSNEGTNSYHNKIVFVRCSNNPMFRNSMQDSVASFTDYFIMDSCNGLLYIVGYNPNPVSFVCNPYLGKFIKLPVLEHPPIHVIYTAVHFGYCHKTQYYKVVQVFTLESSHEVFIHKLGDKSWARLDVQGLGEVQRNIIQGFIVASNVNGALHWVDEFSASCITTFDLEHDEFKEMPGPVIATGRFSTGVVKNFLSIISVHNNTLEVWIMKEYWVAWNSYFVINLAQPFDTTLEFYVLDCRRIEEDEVFIFNDHKLLTYYFKNDTSEGIRFVDDYYRILPHFNTLLSPIHLDEM